MSTTAIQKQDSENSKLYESLALRGDLSALSPQDKAAYYSALCQRLGLDPATQPFALIKLNGKEVMYAKKDCTDQLARLHNVNRQIVEEKELRGVYIVTVEATLPNGRKEQSKGAVNIENAKGDALCNQIMKAETKAKRRATLSILGLGMLDEAELETIPAYHPGGQLPTPSDPERAARTESLNALYAPKETETIEAEVVIDEGNTDADRDGQTDTPHVDPTYAKEEVKELLKVAGINPAGWLKKIDADNSKAGDALREARKKAISTVFGQQKWGQREQEVYLAEFNVTGVDLARATDHQLEVMVTDLRYSGMM